MVTTFYPPYNFGGDGIYIHRLSNELAKRGHKVDIVHCLESFNLLDDGGPLGASSNHGNITVFPLKTNVGFLSPLFTHQSGHSFFKRNTIQSLIEKNEYDVIHYHNMSLIGLETLTFGEAVKLYTAHEHWLVCPMHILWKYNRRVCTKRNCVSCQIYGRRPVQWWRYCDWLEKNLRHLDVLISPSLFTIEKHKEFGLGISMSHLPYFLARDPEDFLHSVENENSGKPYFLFVGRMEKIKGVQTLIRVFKNYPKCDLLLAGDGRYASKLKKMAKGVSNIRFLDRVPYDKLRSLYVNALAVLVPSVCYEVFGIIIIESFAHHTPVIANHLGALPEIVEQADGGFTYTTDQELIEYMEQIRKNPDLRNSLGKNGYQAYQKYWSEDHHIDSYYQLIKQAARKKNLQREAIEALQPHKEQ